MKSNCNSNGNSIIFVKDKSQYDFSLLKKELTEWLKPENTLLNSYCRAYYDVVPMILAEEYFEQLNGQLYDYKFFCFNGEVKFSYVATDHFENGKSVNSVISLYDLEWNLMPIKYGIHNPQKVQRPECLTEMVQYSKKLSEGFPFVRVDFFEVDGKPYLSEMTLYPSGGFSALDSVTQKKWGEMIKLPSKSKLYPKYRFDLLK